MELGNIGASSVIVGAFEATYPITRFILRSHTHAHTCVKHIRFHYKRELHGMQRRSIHRNIFAVYMLESRHGITLTVSIPQKHEIR